MKTHGRYQVLEILGEGGMGIVYRALDPVMNREVTIKTIRDPQNKDVLELFKRECAVLASMTHPNIVEIFDIGEEDDAGTKRPYFVMPLLPGVTLQELIKASSPRLTVERSIQMVVQVCRGLQAAHEHGLVHRDLKPSNLFVMPDDSVKIIDFGMAHLTNQRSATGLKGTLPYMAPEQLKLKQPTPLSDQFSLAVVCYEVLARRHPFSAAGQEDLAQTICNYVPPPISEFNPAVKPSISQVVHKALAKEPFHRWSHVREFSECLQKALHGETIDAFDPTRIAPRLAQARKAFDSGDLDDAADTVKELESEFLDPEIGVLHTQIEDARRGKAVKQLLEAAQRLVERAEYVRALQRVQEVLNLDPANTDAFTLKGAIENQRGATQIEEWFRLASQHMDNHAYAHARQALEKVLELRPKEVRAQTLLAEVERREQEHLRIRNEKEQAYQSALDAYHRGDLNSAINKLERVLDLDRRAPQSASPEQGALYQELYEEVRTKRDQLSAQEAEARRQLNEGNFQGARSICEEVLTAFPNNVLFRVLQDDVDLAQRQEISSYVAKIERDVVAEPDLNRKVSILEEAGKKYPNESHFEQSLRQVRSRRDLVNSIAGRARTFEEQRQFSEALSQWEMLRSIYPQHPGLAIEIDRVLKRREQQVRSDAKDHWVSQIDQALSVRKFSKALTLATDALAEFPEDPELSAIANQVRNVQARSLDAEAKTTEGKRLQALGQHKEALMLMRDAFELDPQNPPVLGGLIEALLREASGTIDQDWHGSEQLVREALELDPNHPLAKSLNTIIRDKRHAQDVSAALTTARKLQSEGRVRDAIIELEKVQNYSQEPRLIQFRNVLQEGLSPQDREEFRARDLAEVRKLADQSQETSDRQALESIFSRSSVFSKYGNDAEFREPLSVIEERLRKQKEVSVSAGTPPGRQLTTPVPPTRAANQKSPPALQSWMEKLTQVPFRFVEPLSSLLKRARATVVRQVKVISAKRKIAIAVGVAITVAVLGIILSKTHREVEVKSALPSTVSVAVNNLEPDDEYHVYDARGNDVTDQLQRGLPPGGYRLSAKRRGFETFEKSYSISLSGGFSQVWDIIWTALQTELTVTRTRLQGNLKVDDEEQTFDGTQFTRSLLNGTHTIRWWTTESNFLQIQFVVDGTDVTLKDHDFRDTTGVLGIVVALRKGQLTYQSINIPGGITKVVGDVSEPLSLSNDTTPIQSDEIITFKSTKSGIPLGSSKPTAQPAIYIYLVMPQPLPAKRLPVQQPPVALPPPPTAPKEPDPQVEINKKNEEDKRIKDFNCKLHPEACKQ